jgi:uncharacterized protein YbaA (DUF1428 family)
MSYVDGFVVPVPKRKVAAYLKMARAAGTIWIDHGAISFTESVADDVPHGKRTSFPRSVKMKPSETVIFSWILYKSRADRDEVMKRVMADKRLAAMMKNRPPFDPKRMIFGGFKIRVAK